MVPVRQGRLCRKVWKTYSRLVEATDRRRKEERHERRGVFRATRQTLRFETHVSFVQSRWRGRMAGGAPLHAEEHAAERNADRYWNVIEIDR